VKDFSTICIPSSMD